MNHTQTCHLHQRKRRCSRSVGVSSLTIQQLKMLTEAMLGKVLSSRYLMQKTMEMLQSFQREIYGVCCLAEFVEKTCLERRKRKV
eukprot:symbB.v1.2.008912.t1/scaffold560.1/size187392/7